MKFDFFLLKFKQIFERVWIDVNYVLDGERVRLKAKLFSQLHHDKGANFQMTYFHPITVSFNGTLWSTSEERHLFTADFGNVSTHTLFDVPIQMQERMRGFKAFHLEGPSAFNNETLPNLRNIFRHNSEANFTMAEKNKFFDLFLSELEKVFCPRWRR